MNGEMLFLAGMAAGIWVGMALTRLIDWLTIRR